MLPENTPCNTSEKYDYPARFSHRLPCRSFAQGFIGQVEAATFRLAADNPLRFSALLRLLPQANKQSLAVALRELEAADLLEKQVIRLKPLHIEYRLSDKGRAMIPIFWQLEGLGERKQPHDDFNPLNDLTIS